MAGFVVQTILMDGEFEKLKDKIHNAVINTTAANEHVGELEHLIQTMNERARGAINTLLFKALPNILL